jgi:hypothetical protein
MLSRARRKSVLRAVARPLLLRLRKPLFRLLRPLVMGIEGQLMHLYERQQADRGRIAQLEHELAQLRRELAAAREARSPLPKRARV